MPAHGTAVLVMRGGRWTSAAWGDAGKQASTTCPSPQAIVRASGLLPVLDRRTTPASLTSS